MLVFINDVIILGGNPDSPLSDDVIYVQPLGILIHKGIGSPTPPSSILEKKRAKNAIDSQGVSEDCFLMFILSTAGALVVIIVM